MMLAVCVSRCCIATHFPHQVLFGAAVGKLSIVLVFHKPYFFSNKTKVFPSQINPKNLGPAYRMDLYIWGCFG